MRSFSVPLPSAPVLLLSVLLWGTAPAWGGPPCSSQGGFLGQGLQRVGGYLLRSSCSDDDMAVALLRVANLLEEETGLRVVRVESWDIEGLANGNSVRLIMRTLWQRMAEWGWVPIHQEAEDGSSFRRHVLLFQHNRDGLPLFVLVGEYANWLSVQVFWLSDKPGTFPRLPWKKS